MDQVHQSEEYLRILKQKLDFELQREGINKLIFYLIKIKGESYLINKYILQEIDLYVQEKECQLALQNLRRYETQ